MGNIPEQRLAKAQFRVENLEAFRQIFAAFVPPFPSLETLNVETVWAITQARTEEELVVAVETAKTELLAQEYAAEYPGRISAHRQFSVSTAGYGPHVETTIVVAPHVGDRVLRIQIAGPDMEVTADYSVRPSLSAATEMRRLATVAAIYRSATVYSNYTEQQELLEKIKDLPDIIGIEWEAREPVAVSS